MSKRSSSADNGTARTGTTYPWARLSDEKLLDLRLMDLGVQVAATSLEDRIDELYDDLGRRGLRFRPHVWLSSEWFTPRDVPGVAVPFYLAHKRLMRLERNLMLECEGGTKKECQMLLRHECGHAIQHAYQLQRLGRWRALFGKSSRRYPDVYRPDPMSRRHVQHLGRFYAQSHPDEDFAETFAVWLQPRVTWRRRYQGWPALEKLEFVDGLMDEIKDTPQRVRRRRMVDPIHTLTTTLREHYALKKDQYETSHPELYDSQLKRLFSDDARHRNYQRASAFLRRNRAEIRHLVARWTGEYEYTLNQVMDDMIDRCRELRLRAVGSGRQLMMDFAVLLTVETMHHHYSRRSWIAL
ncbi:MAG: putative zinc-binding metallopeptidase [Planctomycetota bacterium]